MTLRASILIAAHNEGPCLRKTILSTLAASAGLDVELIVADDASTDDSVDDVAHEFAQVRVCRHERRRGASPTKHLAATQARGDVLLFLDGHTLPEPTALRRLIEDVEATEGDAIMTPAVPHLETKTWTNSRTQVGHGYGFSLSDLSCRWTPLNTLKQRQVGRRTFYESPALIGCVLATSRRLYEELHGFDAQMRSWGVEDLDFGLKAWLCGYPILHDSQAVVGHRFRQSFDNFSVPTEHLWANQLRMARKHLNDATWNHWVQAFRRRHASEDRAGVSSVQPQGLWALAWEIFQEDRASVEQERAYLMARRVHDEFWYAETFGLAWPKLEPERSQPCGCQEEQTNGMVAQRQMAMAQGQGEPSASPSPQPSPSPEPSPSPPPCKILSVSPENLVTCVGTSQTFTAEAENATTITWSSGDGEPATGTGATFSTKWNTPGEKTVSASCDESSASATVTVARLTFETSSLRTGFTFPVPDSTIATHSYLTCDPPHLAGAVDLRSSNRARFTVRIISKDPLTGYVHFSVAGKSQTPNGQQAGDATVNAFVHGKLCAKVPVIVVVPKFLRTPYPEASGEVTAENFLADNTTSPAYAKQLHPNQVARWTIWGHWLTVGVNDQFNEPLGAIYDGAVVREMNEEGDWRSINQPLSATGTYQDPVGWIASPDPQLVLRNSAAAEAWLSEPTVPLIGRKVDDQEIRVSVGGHEINKVIRRVVVQPPSTVTIEWPPR